MKTETEIIPEQKIKETEFLCPKCNQKLVTCPGDKASISHGKMLFCLEDGEVYGHTENKLESAYEFILNKFPNAKFHPKNKSFKK